MAGFDATLTWHYVDHWARVKPDEEALVFGEERLTWADFAQEVDRIALAFLDIGIERGDRIAFLGMARNEFLTTFLAAGKVGATWLGLSPKFSVEELRGLLESSQPKLLISIKEYAGKDLVQEGEDMARQIASLEKALVIGRAVPDAEDFHPFVNRPRPHLASALEKRTSEVTPGDEVLLMYTSGSTGRPKGVLHTHRSVLASATAEVEHFGLHPGSRALLHFPINHVAADVEIGLTAVCAGGAVISMDRFDPEESLRTVERERITLIGQIPTMYLMQMQLPAFDEIDFSSVEAFVWSGAAAPEPLGRKLEAICKKTGARLFNAFGMTELAGLITYTAPTDGLETLLASPGRAVPPFELKIVDEERRELPNGEVGEMAVRGALVMKEYLNDPAATAAALDADGWFYTRDLAKKDDQGYVYLAGRASEMYKSGGENVFPREIESVLEAHPAVHAVAVCGVPDAVYGEVGWAFLVANEGCELDAEVLRAYCHERMANFKVPKRFIVRASLPKLPNGKVDKRALAASEGVAGKSK